MALGLFAIFGIIRYRTDTVEIKEMTYLFIVIGVSVVNSLANQKMSYAEIIASNLIIIGLLYFIEKKWLLQTTEFKKIQYDNIKNIKPENHTLLKADLEERTGLSISTIEILDIDFLKDSANLKISYFIK
jgi:hypothetical protein